MAHPTIQFRAGLPHDMSGQTVRWEGWLACRRCDHREIGHVRGAYVHVPDLAECPRCGASKQDLTPVIRAARGSGASTAQGKAIR